MDFALPLLVALLTPPAVSLNDLDRFPSLAVAQERRQVSYTIWIATRNVNRRYEAWDFRWMEEWKFQRLYDAVQYCDDCWYRLHLARQSGNLEDLQGLRNLLGYDAYYTGTMPPAAPFEEVR